MHDEAQCAAATPVRVPLMAAVAEQLRLTTWYVSPGEPVQRGDVVCEIGVPGIVVTVQAPVTGRLLARGAEIGQPIGPETVLGWLAPGDELATGSERSGAESV